MSCVNRNCLLPLSNFAEGRLFHFELTWISVSADDRHTRADDEIPNRQTLQYWLCGSCSARMTLMMDALEGLKLVPYELGSGECGQLPVVPFHEPLVSKEMV